jgi:hypothetical protein
MGSSSLLEGGYTVEAAYYDHFGTRAFDNNNRLITLSGGHKNLHYLTQFIVTTFYMYFYSVCSVFRPPCPFAVEFSLSSLL